jgi:hypothetical protein
MFLITTMEIPDNVTKIFFLFFNTMDSGQCHKGILLDRPDDLWMIGDRFVGHWIQKYFVSGEWQV